MDANRNVLIIMPAYNEGGNISPVIVNVKKAVPAADLVVVDDGSRDNTKIVARGAGARVLSLAMNMGYGVALQTGYKFAQHHGYDYILQLDADGQHEPDCLNDILAELKSGGADVIIGSRFLDSGSYKPPLVRLLGMRFFSSLTSAITGRRITDPTSGFLGFTRPVLEFLTSEYFPVDYPDADAVIMMHRYGFRIKEIPVRMKASTGKSMHSGFKPVYYVFKMLLSVFVTLLRKKRSRS